MNDDNRAILRLAIPSVVSNITVPLIGLVDIAITGHLGGAVLISAIAVGAMTFNIIYWLFGFLRMGTSGLVAQAVGRSDHTEPVLIAWRVLSVGIALGLLFILLRVPLFRLSSLAFSTPEAVLPAVSQYFSICIYGAPAMLSLYGLTGWFIGMQDTRTPMVVAILQNIVNMAVGITLAVFLGWGIKGIATGTLVAQWTGFILSFALMILKMRHLGLHREFNPRLIFNGEEIKKFFSVNADIFLRTVCIVAVNLYFTSAGSRQGPLILAVNTVLMTFYTIFSYFMDGFAYAGEALCGKLYGRRDWDALRSMIRRLLGWGVAVALAFTLLYFFGGNLLVELLTDDGSVVDCARQYRLWSTLVPLTGMAAFVLDGVFVGITASKGMLASAAASAVLFFAIAIALMPSMGNHGVWLAFIIYLSTRGLVEWMWLKRLKRINHRAYS